MTIKIEIIKNGNVIATDTIFSDEWNAYNFVDYIEVDEDNEVTEDFRIAHGATVCEAMQFFVDCAIG